MLVINPNHPPPPQKKKEKKRKIINCVSSQFGIACSKIMFMKLYCCSQSKPITVHSFSNFLMISPLYTKFIVWFDGLTVYSYTNSGNTIGSITLRNFQMFVLYLTFCFSLVHILCTWGGEFFLIKFFLLQIKEEEEKLIYLKEIRWFFMFYKIWCK